MAGARKGKGEGKIGCARNALGKGEESACSPLFFSSCALINMQTDNVHDLLLVKCQPMSVRKNVGLNIHLINKKI